MKIAGKQYPPPLEFWVPDYTDFSLPVKPGGEFYLDPEGYEEYLNWLVAHLERNKFPPNDHHKEILNDPAIKEYSAERLGLWLGAASISRYYWFVEPEYEYPCDFLDDPRPERVCDPEKTEWDSSYFDPEGDDTVEVPGIIDLNTFLVFDCMCWEASKEYERKSFFFPGHACFSDLGWRPLLKEAISRTDNWWEKKKALKLFHDEYAYLAGK